MINFFKRQGTVVVHHWVGFSVLAGVILMISALVWWLIPNQLVIAAGNTDLDEPRIVQLLAETLKTDRASVRIVPLWTNGTAQSAQALASGKADLAVTRSDLELLAGASSLASLRKFYPVIFTRPESKIKKIADLRGKKIGFGGAGDINALLLKQLLAHWRLQENDYTLVRVQRGGQEDSVKSGAIDAFFSVSSGSIKTRAAFNDNLRKAWSDKMVMIAFDDASALTQRIRGAESGEIAKGFYAADPAIPAADTDTIFLSNRLVSTEKLSISDAVVLSKALITMRDRRQADTPEVLTVQEPARNIPTLPVHPGTLQLLDGQYQTFLDRYINHMFIGAALLGGLGSVVTAFTSRRRKASQDKSVDDLHSLLSLHDEINTANDPEQLSKLLLSVDEILQRTLIACAHGEVTPSSLTVIQGAVSRCHRVADAKIAFSLS